MGFCPSCCARDAQLGLPPRRPFRKYVLSYPFLVRLALARSPRATTRSPRILSRRSPASSAASRAGQACATQIDDYSLEAGTHVHAHDRLGLLHLLAARRNLARGWASWIEAPAPRGFPRVQREARMHVVGPRRALRRVDCCQHQRLASVRAPGSLTCPESGLSHSHTAAARALKPLQSSSSRRGGECHLGRW